MNDLKPIDLLNKKFSRKVRGYNPSEVDEFLRAAASAYEDSLAEIKRLNERVSALEADLGRFRSVESTLNNALLLAQKTAEETKDAAQREADLIIREAGDKVQRDLEKAHSELEDLHKDRDRFTIEFRAMLRSYLELCESRRDGENADSADA